MLHYCHALGDRCCELAGLEATIEELQKKTIKEITQDKQVLFEGRCQSTYMGGTPFYIRIMMDAQYLSVHTFITEQDMKDDENHCSCETVRMKKLDPEF